MKRRRKTGLESLLASDFTEKYLSTPSKRTRQIVPAKEEHEAAEPVKGTPKRTKASSKQTPVKKTAKTPKTSVKKSAQTAKKGVKKKTTTKKTTGKKTTGKKTQKKPTKKRETADAIPNTLLSKCAKDFALDRHSQMAKNVIANDLNHDYLNLLIDRDVRTSERCQHVFSDVIKKEGKPTSQRASGRCWMFAGLNLMRVQVMRRLGLPDNFEFSESYLFFFDKLERTNYFLEQIMDTLGEPVESRLVMHLLKSPVMDGGQWDMFVNLVHKYGLVPKSVFPETLTSGSSRQMNRLITHKLRQFAMELRTAAAAGSTVAQLRTQLKPKMLKIITRILLVFFGAPPTTFDWSYYSTHKDKKFVCVKGLTPRSFLTEHVQFPITSYVSLINDPRNEYYKLYSVDRLGNTLGQDTLPIRYINLPIEELKRYAAYTLLTDGIPVWFGCDFGKHNHRPLSVLDTKLLDKEMVFGPDAGDGVMSKADRLLYRESLMTHAMVFTGLNRAVPEDEKAGGVLKGKGKGKGKDKGKASKGKTKKGSKGKGKGVKKAGGKGKKAKAVEGAGPIPPEFAVEATKWRVENSHGEKGAGKGFMIMTDEWFNEFMYQIAVNKATLAPEVLAILEQTPTVLPPWDPMGSLACNGDCAAACE